MADVKAPRQIGEIRTGLFKIRLVRHGPWVGAAIQHDAAGWYALVDGVRSGDPASDPRTAPDVEKIWLFGREIDAGEYRKLTRTDRSVPIRQPIDLNAANPIF